MTTDSPQTTTEHAAMEALKLLEELRPTLVKRVRKYIRSLESDLRNAVCND